MKKIFNSLWLCLCLQVLVHAAPIEENYFVTKIIDGDSLIIESKGKTHEARLSQIDAPEYKQTFGKEAQQKLSELCLHKTAQLRMDDVDSYQRKVIWLFCDGVEINTTLVQQGYAWHYKKYAKDKRLAALELTAKTTRQGLWENPKAIPPWQWRKQNPR